MVPGTKYGSFLHSSNLFFLANIFELLLCVNQEMGEGESNPD